MPFGDDAGDGLTGLLVAFLPVVIAMKWIIWIKDDKGKETTYSIVAYFGSISSMVSIGDRTANNWVNSESR